MKKRIMWLLLSCLMAASLVLASCAAAVEEEEGKTIVGKVIEKEEEVVEEEEEVVEGPEMVPNSLGKMVEKPQYGGSITFLVWGTATEIFDPAINTRSAQTAIMTYERMGTADWLRGPSGTGENTFESTVHPVSLQVGAIAESWEILDLQTVRFTIREGIRWQNVPPVNGRELTVEDVYYTLDRCAQTPQNLWYTGDDPPEQEREWILIIDDRTIEVWYDEPSVGMEGGLLSWIYIVPREMVEEYGDLGDWRHQCGTGAWMVDDVVVESSITWKRNPNYWMHDPLHPENRLPYADIARGLLIPDESTRLAALRTHKIDHMGVAWDKADGMKRSNPELINRRVLPTGGASIWLNINADSDGNSDTVFADKRVRHALMLAINQQEILEDFYGGDAYMLCWPVMPNFVEAFTPLEELPDNLRELFEYHPDKARQLLAEAGYPNGFKTEVIVSATSARAIDLMSIVKGYFADVGVDMDINVMESSSFGSSLYARSFPGMAYWGIWENNGLYDALGWASGGWASRDDDGNLLAMSIYNFGGVVDPVAEEVLDLYSATVDTDERMGIVREENLRQMELQWELQLPTAAFYLFWVPWLKGYNGERGMGPDSPENNGIWQYVWIDQDLKYEMTGKRGVIK